MDNLNLNLNKDNLNSLFKDIINFKSSLEIIEEIYFIKFKYLLEYENYADKYWLVSDILLYLKKNNYSKFIKINKVYNKNIVFNNTIYNQVKFYWGKLTIEDRNKFLNIMKK